MNPHFSCPTGVLEVDLSLSLSLHCPLLWCAPDDHPRSASNSGVSAHVVIAWALLRVIQIYIHDYEMYLYM